MIKTPLILLLIFLSTNIHGLSELKTPEENFKEIYVRLYHHIEKLKAGGHLDFQFRDSDTHSLVVYMLSRMGF